MTEHHFKTTSTIKDLKPTRKEASITVAKEEVVKIYQSHLHKIGQQAKIKGFRPGKVPTNILVKQFGHEIDRGVVTELVEGGLHATSHEQHLTVVSRPEISFAQFAPTEDFHFTAVFDVRPEVQAKGYRGVPVTKLPLEITGEEIAKELDILREQHATLTPVAKETPVAAGLVVRFDFEGRIADKVFKGGSAQNYLLEIGRGEFLPDFEAQLLGLCAGESKQIHITFPGDYFEAALRGKPAVFSVVIGEVHSKKLPALDDEFAKDMSQSDFAALKEFVRAQLATAKEAGHKRIYEQKILEYLVSLHEFEIPESMLKQEEEQARASREEVIFRLRAAMILESVQRQEKIEIEMSDIEAKFAELAAYHRQPIESVKKFYAEKNLLAYLVHQIGNQKTLDFVLANAKMSG